MSIITDTKEIVDLVKKLGEVELYRKIVNLEEEIYQLSRENRDCRERVDELETALAFQGELTFRAPMYYAIGDDVPYCPNCWEGDDRAIHMILWPSGDYHCPQCKTMCSPR